MHPLTVVVSYPVIDLNSLQALNYAMFIAHFVNKLLCHLQIVVVGEFALIVQWIEYLPPKEKIPVRVWIGVLTLNYSPTYDYKEVVPYIL